MESHCGTSAATRPRHVEAKGGLGVGEEDRGGGARAGACAPSLRRRLIAVLWHSSEPLSARRIGDEYMDGGQADLATIAYHLGVPEEVRVVTGAAPRTGGAPTLPRPSRGWSSGETTPVRRCGAWGSPTDANREQDHAPPPWRRHLDSAPIATAGSAPTAAGGRMSRCLGDLRVDQRILGLSSQGRGRPPRAHPHACRADGLVLLA